MAGLKMNVEFPTRLCEVNGELGYFHLWEQWSNVIVLIRHPSNSAMRRMPLSVRL
jgi:hypothetical protein